MKNYSTKKISLLLSSCASALFISGPLSAQELAVDPGDVVAQPIGTSVAVLYYQNASSDKLYSAGDFIDNADLETNIGLLRLGRYVEVGSFTVLPQIVLPYGRLGLGQSQGNQPPVSDTGFGDPIIGATTWVVSDPESKTWFGLPFYLFLPAGDYESDRGPFNIGENRWKAVLQAGYAKGLFDRFLVELIGEYAVFGKNDDYYGMTMKQDETISFSGNFTYQLTAKTTMSMSYYHTFEGETQVEGIDQSDRKNNSRWLASVASWIAPRVNIQLQYGQDIHVENGLKESDRFNIRLAKLF